MNELQVIVNTKVGEIIFNFDEIKTTLETELKKYNGLIISDESQIKEFKDTKAHLNKVKKAIDDERKRIKKEAEAPIEAFETQVKELTKMIDDVNSPIDNQLKEYEDKRKQEKLECIKNYFEGLNFTLVSFEQLFEDQWLNATYTEKKWQDDLNYKIANINEAMKTIDLMGDVEYSTLIKSFYISGGNFDALGIGEAKAQADRRIELTKKVAPPVEQKTVKKQPPKRESNDELLTAIFKVTATKVNLIKIREYMKELGVKYE